MKIAEWKFMNRRLLITAASVSLPYAMMSSKYFYLRGVSSLSLMRRLSSARFDPASLAQTESNMQTIKNLVALTASEIINPTLSQLATKKDLERVEGSLHTEIERVEGSLHQEIERVEISLHQEIERVEGSLHTEIERVEVSLHQEIERVEISLHQEIERVEGSLRREMDEGFKRSDEKMEAGFKAADEKLGLMNAKWEETFKRMDERMLTREDFFKSRDEDRQERQKERQKNQRWAVGTGMSVVAALYAAGFFNKPPEKADQKKSDAVQPNEEKTVSTQKSTEPESSSLWSWLPKF